jgi:hypothetical protein
MGRTIAFHAHVQISVRDSSGRAYEYHASNEVVDLAPVTSKDEYIGLISGYSYGVEDITNGQIAISMPGRYSIYVSYGDNGDADSAAELGIVSWSGSIDAKPIHVTVR